MDLTTTGEMSRKFLEADPGTIVRKNNIRTVVLQYGIRHSISRDICLFDGEEFIRVLNPRGIKRKSKLPRMRNIQTAMREWNESHKTNKIDKHAVENCMRDSSVFKMKRGNVWLINYDQLERVLKSYVKTHKYVPGRHLSSKKWRRRKKK